MQGSDAPRTALTVAALEPDDRAAADGAREPHWAAPVRVVRPLLWVLVALCVVGPSVRLAVDAVRDRPDLPQTTLSEVARLVDLDAEANIPTWFSVVLLGGVGAGLAVAALLERSRGRRAWPLAVPAVVGAYLSLDELASIHEQLALLSQHLGVDGGLAFAWVVPGAVVAVVVGAVLLAVARRMSSALRRRLVVSGVVYLAGALGVEALASPLFRPTPPGALRAPAQSVAYVLLNIGEEGLEMLGALLALRAVLLLLRVAVTARGLVVELDPAQPALRP